MLRAIFLLIRFRGVVRLLWRLTLDRQVPLAPKMLLPVAIAYIVLPVDIIPDFLPFLGRIDDLLVLVLGALLFIALAPREIVTQHLHGYEPVRSATRRDEGPVIDGKYRIADED
ncbi:DUF1232 domain-containing protein [Dehalococcoidia bacterium]|nr:DUF1232 domain-containing protein [Dehalococcoidia bacterium]